MADLLDSKNDFVFKRVSADEPTRAAYDKLERVSADVEARRLAFVRERALHDEASLMQDAREEGREEGEKQGRNAALRETAALMIRRTDLDNEAIAAITGLDAAEISALRRTGG